MFAFMFVIFLLYFNCLANNKWKNYVKKKSRAWLHTRRPREPLTTSHSRAVNNFSTARYRALENVAALIACASEQTRVRLCRVNALRGLFKRMHPARVPHSRSPGRASFTRPRTGTGCRSMPAIRYPAWRFRSCEGQTRVNCGRTAK